MSGTAACTRHKDTCSRVFPVSINWLSKCHHSCPTSTVVKDAYRPHELGSRQSRDGICTFPCYSSRPTHNEWRAQIILCSFVHFRTHTRRGKQAVLIVHIQLVIRCFLLAFVFVRSSCSGSQFAQASSRSLRPFEVTGQLTTLLSAGSGVHVSFRV